MANRRPEGDIAVKLSVRVNDREASLEFVREGGRCRFRFGGSPEQDAALEEVEPGVYSVLVNGRSYEAKIEPGVEGVFVTVAGRRFAVDVRDPRRWDASWRGRHGEGRQNVATPMPGKVVRVLVSEGDSVEAGQGVAVVEAMKMQNEMKAPKAGRIVSLAAREGETVTAGQVLAVIE
jgi:biotin carboxyl carrier protein